MPAPPSNPARWPTSPPDPKDDKQLNYAIDLLRGLQVNALSRLTRIAAYQTDRPGGAGGRRRATPGDRWQVDGGGRPDKATRVLHARQARAAGALRWPSSAVARSWPPAPEPFGCPRPGTDRHRRDQRAGKGNAGPADRTGAIASRPARRRRPTPAAAAPSPERPGLIEVEPPRQRSGLTEVGKVVIYDPSKPPPMVLAALPDHALVEMSNYGPLPKVAADGRRPLDAYARPAIPAVGEPRIAIVIGGVGIDAAGTDRAIADSRAR